MSITEIEFLIKLFLQTKLQAQISFTAEFYQTVKEEIEPIIHIQTSEHRGVNISK